MRWPNVASTTTVIVASGMIFHECRDGLVELLQAGERPTFGRDVGAVDHEVARS